jgi:TP901-1 family phage major tail protein
MAAQKGKDLLIKLGDGGAPEAFSTVAGLRTASLGFNAAIIDITNADSADQWRELLGNSGARSASVSGAGVFKDAASDAAVRTLFFSQDLRNWRIVIPDFGEVTGAFAVTGLQYEGAYDGEVRMSLTLASAGTLSFTAL